ncbi:MAG: hypothetical protein JSV18_01665 [Candidatus Bathyarchaeota archaeon]|nr:MAG: hypothetical protein JSV18_01665 [Candidatus Bathyarchaeota archaeon]
MSIDEETIKLIRLRKITQELQSKRDILQRVWANMQNFTQGLRNELDEQYWSENKIVFVDLESSPQFNQFRFTYSELEKLFDIAFIKETLEGFRTFSIEKTRLEAELGISMDSPGARMVRSSNP